MDYITALEEALGMEAQKNMMPIQPGDVLTPAQTPNRCMTWWALSRKLQ